MIMIRGGFWKVYALVGVLGLCRALAWAGEAESWSGSDFTRIGQEFFRGEEHLRLQVPSSFEGRSVDERRTTKGVELFDGVRFERIDSTVKLRGSVTIFDFDYQKDKLDVMIHRSHAARPGANSCMDCHGGRTCRTTVIIGRETQALAPKPISRGNVRFTIDDVLQQSSHIQLTHWLNSRFLARADYRAGTLSGGGSELWGKAATFGLSGVVDHHLNWDGRLIYTKTETYKAKRVFLGDISYRLGKRVKFTFGGGAFLDGYVHFGTDMSELGAITFNLEKNDPQLLPTLFTRLRDSKFGFLKTSVQYEYPF
ncbi:MAG: hypothetical protein HQM09_14405 [Candidatus Riflebacteria bacterium]|nr:hypothetical protein [Candidatus Riflebacteria bacterium]